jgi:hypothetical protein
VSQGEEKGAQVQGPAHVQATGGRGLDGFCFKDLAQIYFHVEIILKCQKNYPLTAKRTAKRQAFAGLTT